MTDKYRRFDCECGRFVITSDADQKKCDDCALYERKQAAMESGTGSFKKSDGSKWKKPGGSFLPSKDWEPRTGKNKGGLA